MGYNYYIDATQALSGNRDRYNKLNDSIFNKQTRDEWIQSFRHRADVFSQIYYNDREIINTIKYDVEHYALADSVLYHNGATIEEMYTSKSIHILNQMTGFVLHNHDDPFLVKDIAKPICDLIIRKMPESELSLMAAHLMSECYLQILRFTDDKKLEDEFIKYCEHGIHFDTRIPYINNTAIRSYVRGSYVRLFSYKSEHVGDVLMRNYYRLKKLMDNKDLANYFKTHEADRRMFVSILSTSAYSILRNYFMTYEWDKHTHFTDSVARLDFARQSTYNNVTQRAAIARSALTKVYLGTQTFDEAFAETHAFYADSLAPTERINVKILPLYTNPILNLVYLLDNSTLPFQEKRAYILNYVDAILQSVRNCKDNQSNNIRNAVVTRFLGYDRILKYLTSEEKEDFFHTLLAYTQVQTYAHSKQVSDLCVAVTNAIIDKRPELLVGMLGTRNKGDVRKNRQRFLKLIANAGLYHDLGKLSMAELVKNDYRPMTDDEFAIIKTHPERGAKYLECDSAMMQYRDFALGHHKWYNGKGGYPRDYDNTKSPYRTLVDVLTICDCLDAATDRVGRNYASKKTYTDLVNEFQAQSGTRYNPDIVKILATDKKTISVLSSIVNDGWLSNYYEIFKDYFSE